MERELATFGNTMEADVYGFSQGVRVGDTIHVAGQTAMADDFTVGGKSDMKTQMQLAYANIGRVLAQLGAGLGDVVDETLFVTDIPAAVACAHSVRNEVFGGRFALASSLVGVASLGHPDILVEIKCTAQVGAR